MTHAVSEFIRALDLAQRMAAAGARDSELDDALDCAEEWLRAADAELTRCARTDAMEAHLLGLRARLDRLRWTLNRVA